MIGYAAIALALVFSVVAAKLFITLVNNNDRQRTASTAKILYILSVILIGIAAVYLLYLILSNKFEYAYVFGYSSGALPLVYKLSAFWAGQEGSFLLWLVFHAIFGAILLRKPSASEGVLAVHCTIQAALLVILLVKSPFMMLAQLPIDGVGLNPLLQDPWMVIHPPVIFFGYAALAVPFAYALDGIITGRHHEWVEPAKFWILLALSSLGAGMFIGGYWAYKVLGWGGYWAWDPVENSSLVPWLAAAATLHLLAMAKVRASAVRFAYIGSILSFLLVLYGTFLTRSGILSDFSTHSFTDEGIGGLLGIVVLTFFTVSFVLYIIKLTTMPAGELYPGIASREFILAVTSLLLFIFGLLVFAGMSTPLVTMAFGSPKSISSVFYNSAALPLAAGIGGLLVIAPFVKWSAASEVSPKCCCWLGMAAAMGFLLAEWLKLLDKPLLLIVLCLAIVAVTSQVYSTRVQSATRGDVYTHLGVAIILIGILASGAGSKTESVVFTQGQPKQIFGELVTYVGTETEPTGVARYNTFQIGDNNSTIYSLTKLNKDGQPAAREPGIYRQLLSDLYIAPVVDAEAEHGAELTLNKGQSLMHGDVQLKFVKFNMTGMDGTGSVRVQAVIEVKANNLSEEIRPELTNQNGQIIGSTIKAFDRYEIHIVGLKPGDGKVFIEFKDVFNSKVSQVETLEAEVSQKPLIILVWFGAFLITVGTGWAGVSKFSSYQQSVSKGQNAGAGLPIKPK